MLIIIIGRFMVEIKKAKNKATRNRAGMGKKPMQTISGALRFKQ